MADWERKLCDIRSFLACSPSVRPLCILCTVAALGGAAWADPPAARATVAAPPASQAQVEQTVQARKAAPTPQAVAVDQRSDRLAILIQERNEILSKQRKWDANGDKSVLARIQADLQSIDREIALVSRQPVYPISSVAPSQVANAKPASAASAANQESQTKGGEKLTHEGWDVFKNFGRKGN